VHPGPDGELPRLSTLSPYKLGAWPSRYGDEEHEGWIRTCLGRLTMDEALREKPFVLVVGDSLAGKSRTAYEAARRLTRDGVKHDPVVLVPKGAASLEGFSILISSLNGSRCLACWRWLRRRRVTGSRSRRRQPRHLARSHLPVAGLSGSLCLALTMAQGITNPKLPRRSC
jgi:hypothetical protein